MVKAKRIGIIYNYDENWVGGTYYVQNLISSLNFLPFEQQPILYILAKEKSIFNDLKQITNYPKLIFQNDSLSKFERVINKIVKKIFKRNNFLKRKAKVDFLFPVSYASENLKEVSNIRFWIPDLQEKYLPHFFSDKEIEIRKNRYIRMIEQKHPIIFSSHSAKKDFENTFPNTINKKLVIQFAVVHPQINYANIDIIKSKFKIEGDYFISPNQFWQHKNHIALIKAAKILKDNGSLVKIIFTGKEFDYRYPDYTTNLKKIVKEYNLENEVRFLGFIDREEQLTLMKFAIAVVQPSLFEGWSTVVEDAKALNQTIIASKIEVHKEQLETNAYYFSPNNYMELATILKDVMKNESKIQYKVNYKNNIVNFATNLKQLINDTI